MRWFGLVLAFPGGLPFGSLCLPWAGAGRLLGGAFAAPCTVCAGLWAVRGAGPPLLAALPRRPAIASLGAFKVCRPGPLRRHRPSAAAASVGPGPCGPGPPQRAAPRPDPGGPPPPCFPAPGAPVPGWAPRAPLRLRVARPSVSGLRRFASAAVALRSGAPSLRPCPSGRRFPSPGPLPVPPGRAAGCGPRRFAGSSLVGARP